MLFNSDSNAAEEVEQDPKHMARSSLNKPIGVPLCAVSVSRAFRVNAKAAENTKSTDAGPKKKRKGTSSSRTSSVGLANLANMVASEDEDISDITFLFSDDEADESQLKGKWKENWNS
jgi:ubiquitin-conjugating enzyme E2 Q